MNEVDPRVIKLILETTEKLTKLRQNECKHLCIENFAPELFGKMVFEYRKSLGPMPKHPFILNPLDVDK